MTCGVANLQQCLLKFRHRKGNVKVVMSWNWKIPFGRYLVED